MMNTAPDSPESVTVRMIYYMVTILKKDLQVFLPAL